MNAVAPTAITEPHAAVRPVWVRVVRGEIRLGRRRVELVPAQIFADVPPGFLGPRALALITDNAQWLTYLSLARPLVLQPSSVEGRYTIVAGLETWCAVRAVGLLATPVMLNGCVLETPHEDPESIAGLLLALSTGMTTRTPRGTIARRTRALLDQVLDEGQRLLVAEVSDLHGVSRQALSGADRRTGTNGRGLE